jgi:SAM-dependent methyltransferase
MTHFTNRLRANSFGGAAPAYDAHRPRYPDDMIDDLMTCGARRILDVGAGTGIASQQFADRGAQVLAVEPDARMAALARLKQIPIEIDTFERWDPAGRSFDLVVFAASFHWVDPAIALPKVRAVLRLIAELTAAGYTVVQHTYSYSLEYSRERWLDYMFTHSSHLILTAEAANELRTRLADCIGADGVSVGGDALAIAATPS